MPYEAKVNYLADFIEQHQELPFDMTDASPPSCGTPGCIGGFASVLFGDRMHWDAEDISHWLGISEHDADRLCYYPRAEDGQPLDLERVTRSQAVAALRRLANTGEVWF